MRNSTLSPHYTAGLKRIFKFIILASFIFISNAGFGQLLQWNTFGNLGTETTEPSTFNNANISAANITLGTITPTANANRLGGSGWFNTGNTVGGNTLAEAVAGNDYMQFIVTPNAGFSFTPTSFVFRWDRSGTGPSSATLRSSADGFTADLGTVTGMVSGGAATTTDRTITISGLTNITTATTFRLYGYAATATGGTGGFDNATSVVDVQLIGTTAPVVTTYTVTYDGNFNTSGGVPIDASSPYSSGATVTVKANTGSLVRTGYTFTGWNTAANGSGISYAATGSVTFTMPSNAVILYAQWTINTYTVTYNGNGNDGGTAPVDGSSPYNYNSNVTVLGVGTLTLTGFTFNGWNTAANGSGTAYAAGGTITGIATNITLFAQWIPANTYSVIYDGNSNTGGTAPVDGSSPYISGSNATVLGAGTLIKTGYTFNGWNTAANGSGTSYAAGGTISNIVANITLYAQWTINTYTVTYDGNGNTGGTAPVDGSSPYNYNSNVTVLGAGTLTRTNYNFTGWNTAANGSGTAYAAGGTITGIAANTILYAQWAIITYTVTYNGNTNTGGTAPVDGSSPYNSGSNVTVLGAGTLVKTGNTFAGWNTLANGTGTAYSAGGTITSIAANTTLFAQWTINTYTVTYDGNGNTGGTAPVDGLSPYNFGTTVTVLANTGSLVKTGATFVGWNTAANATGTNYAATGAATFTLGAANVILYAKWAVPLYEGFSYTAGGNVGGSTSTAGTTNNNWTTHSNSLAGTINVVSGSLNYTGLQVSTGNRISLPGSNATVSRDINRSAGLIPSQNITYYSFLLNVTDATQLATAFGTGGNGYFVHLCASSGNTTGSFSAKVYIRSSNIAANFRLGVSESGNTPTEASGDLSFGTTYLVVVKFVYNNTAGFDLATLWVNPASLGGTEPAGGVNGPGSANLAAYNSANTGVCIRNASATPKADIDEIRTGTTWASVTPVSSFTITATAQTAGGSISPAGAVSVNGGGSQTFTITPDACNDIAEVIVDGTISLGAATTYTFTNVTANHTIDAYFNPSTSTTWTGIVSTDWDNAANWSGCLPNGTLDVVIAAPGGTVLFQPVLNVDAAVNGLTINDGATFSLNGKTLTINGGFTGSAASVLTGSDASSLVLNSTTTLISSGAIRLHSLAINGGTTTLSSVVEISGGTATVSPGEVLVPTGSQLASNGFLTIKSNSFGTARVAAGDDAGNYITGNVTVERYIPANSFRSWRLLAVPTFGNSQTFKQSWQENNTPLGNINPNFGTQITGTGVLATAQAAGFDNVGQSAALLSWTGSAWSGVTNTNTNVIDTKKGYFLYIRGERTQGVTNSTSSPTATTLRTKGQLYQGTQAIPSFPANSFNLVGNLYPSAIDFTQLTRTGGVNNLFYIWDSKKLNGSSLGTYQTFSATNSFNCLIGGGSYTLGQPNTKIESGQAFFVSTTTAGSITLTEGSKIANGANLGFRPITPVNALVKIDSRLYAAGSTEIADANAVVFNDKYTNAVADEDAAKLTNPAENFGIQQAGKTLSIEGRHTITGSDNIQFNMWNLKEQQYKLEFVPQNMATQGLTAILEDKYLHTNTPVSLDATNSINFTADANAASKATDRFRIVFTKVKPDASGKQGYSIAPNPVENGKVNLVFNNREAGMYSVKIVSNSGQAISTKVINHAGGNSNQQITLPQGIASGMYKIEIIAPNHTKTIESLLVN